MSILDLLVILIILVIDNFVHIPYLLIVILLALIIERLIKGERIKV